jgi:NAD(P)-dependent dehydrogenase (short-subunit alcohol dehydrogenase family)
MTKVALVTGPSAGIGEATLGRLIRAGCKTYAAARRLDRMRSLEQLGAILMPLDLTDDKSIIQAAQRIRAEQGRIDALLNNAGYGSYGAVEDVSLEEAHRQFEVNVFGLARLVQLFTPIMRRQGSGKIVNVSSIGGKGWEPLGACITPPSSQWKDSAIVCAWNSALSASTSLLSSLAPFVPSGAKSPLTRC